MEATMPSMGKRASRGWICSLACCKQAKYWRKWSILVSWFSLPKHLAIQTNNQSFQFSVKNKSNLSFFRYSKESLNLEAYTGKYLVIDIPVKYSVIDIACCDLNGNIAVATQAKIILYLYKKWDIDITVAQENAFVVDFDILMEIDAGFQINQVSLYGNYIGFASVNEIMVIQVSFDQKENICQAEDVSEMME